METGSDEWLARADKLAEQRLCSYCGKHPIRREGPGGLGICGVCDGILDKPDAGCTNPKCVHYHEYEPVIARRIIEHCDHAGYKFTARDWHTHWNKIPLEQMVCMMLDELADKDKQVS